MDKPSNITPFEQRAAREISNVRNSASQQLERAKNEKRDRLQNLIDARERVLGTQKAARESLRETYRADIRIKDEAIKQLLEEKAALTQEYERHAVEAHEFYSNEISAYDTLIRSEEASLSEMASPIPRTGASELPNPVHHGGDSVDRLDSSDDDAVSEGSAPIKSMEDIEKLFEES